MNQEVHLKNAPMIETWLEIQWKLSESEIPNIELDKKFPFALGVFKTLIEEEYPHVSVLNQGLDAPMPFRQVRYRFTKGEKNTWPLINIGPGIASVNTCENYSWHTFKQEINFLINHLCKSYKNEIEPQAIALRYRNVIPVDYTKENVLEFLSKNLNLVIRNPDKVPGENIQKPYPSEFIFSNSFMIGKPKGKSKYSINSGSNNVTKEMIIMLELEFLSLGGDAPDISDDSLLDPWLEGAHDILHSWFFSFIDGNMLESYLKGE